MKKLLIFSALLFAAHAGFAAPPKTGGYLGHRVIVGGALGLSPFCTSLKDFYTKYNFQYGGELGLIVGRRTQLNLTYNRWSLGNNQVFQSDFVSSDRVNGVQYGLTLRSFRVKRGGLAPIGKFWDIGVGYAQNKFEAGADNPIVLNGESSYLPVSSDLITAHVSFGTQAVFWGRLVGSTGVRFGAPLLQVNNDSGTYYPHFLYERMLFKDLFSVFFGLGVLI